MSSKPSAQGVRALLDKVNKLRELDAEIETLRTQNQRLKLAEEEYGIIHREITTALGQMDVAFVWFLMQARWPGKKP